MSLFPAGMRSSGNGRDVQRERTLGVQRLLHPVKRSQFLMGDVTKELSDLVIDVGSDQDCIPSVAFRHETAVHGDAVLVATERADSRLPPLPGRGPDRRLALRFPWMNDGLEGPEGPVDCDAERLTGIVLLGQRMAKYE